MRIYELKSTDNRIVTVDLATVTGVEKDNTTFEISTDGGNCYSYFALDQYEAFMAAWKAVRS